MFLLKIHTQLQSELLRLDFLVLPIRQDSVGLGQKIGQVDSHEREAEHGDAHGGVGQRHLHTEHALNLPHYRHDSANGQVALTLAMSQTVTSSQVAARSKLCTPFFTLRAILQSPQPKSATTREEGLEDMMECSRAGFLTVTSMPEILMVTVKKSLTLFECTR